MPRPRPCSAAAAAAAAAVLVPLALAAGPGCTVTRAGYPDPGNADGPHPMLARAEQSYLRGNLDEALQLYRGYRQGFAGDALAGDTWYWEGVILLEQGALDGAEQAFGRSARAPGSRFLEAQSYMGLGDCAFARERWDHALAHYQRALDLGVPEARNDYALYRLGVTRQRLGDWGGGQSYFHLLLREHPRSPLTGRVRERLAAPARAFHVELGRFAEARAAELERMRIRALGIDSQLVECGPATFAVWVGPFRRYEDANARTAELTVRTGTAAIVVP